MKLEFYELLIESKETIIYIFYSKKHLSMMSDGKPFFFFLLYLLVNM